MGKLNVHTVKAQLQNGLTAEISPINKAKINQLTNGGASFAVHRFHKTALSRRRTQSTYCVTVMIKDEKLDAIYELSGFAAPIPWLIRNIKNRLEYTLDLASAIIYKNTCYSYDEHFLTLLEEGTMAYTTFGALKEAILSRTEPGIIVVLRKTAPDNETEK
jgi:hypothetical protein